jgi:hypothetical protein
VGPPSTCAALSSVRKGLGERDGGFGGIDILVPDDWRIGVRSTPIFGGVEDKRDHSRPVAADAPTLHIDAVTLFGGVEIKSDK